MAHCSPENLPEIREWVWSPATPTEANLIFQVDEANQPELSLGSGSEPQWEGIVEVPTAGPWLPI
jgi:hypothetical protein